MAPQAPVLSRRIAALWCPPGAFAIRDFTPVHLMLIQLLATAALLAPATTPATSAVPTAQPCSEGHGKLSWFEGSYEEALAKAASEKKIIFMDFWTDW